MNSTKQQRAERVAKLLKCSIAKALYAIDVCNGELLDCEMGYGNAGVITGATADNRANGYTRTGRTYRNYDQMERD